MPGKVLVLLALASHLPSQGPLDVPSVRTLHEAGVPATEIGQLIDRHGVSGLDAKALEHLRTIGLHSDLLQKLQTELSKHTVTKLTLEDVVALVNAGIPADEVIARLRKTNSRFDLTIDDVVSLARKRVPATVIKEMRASSRAADRLAKATTTVTLEDVIDMAAAKITSDEILRRIRKVDARFDVAVDDLLDLSRKGIPQPVLKEIWARKAEDKAKPSAPTGNDPQKQPADAGTPSAPAQPAKPAQPTLVTHVEPSGGFSINVPKEFVLYREGRNANSLVSFTDRAVKQGEGQTDAELQVLRYRSRKPDWLVESNLDAVGKRFLTMLKAGYVKKGLSLTHSDAESTHASGRPARIYRVGSSARDGTSHEGRLLVTWQNDQVFVLSYAVRADLVNTVGHLLNECLRSFTFESRKAIELAENQDPLSGLFDAWREAVTQRDFALYRELFPAGFDTAGNRRAFVDLSDRLANKSLRLSMGAIERGEKDAQIECKIIGPTSTETMKLAVTKRGDEFLLLQNS